MRRQATCNLLATLSYPPWTKDLNREVYMTSGGEERIPFHVYVQPSNICTVALQHSVALSTFLQLPEEIQLHVLAMCSASTLFQLMRTTSKLRIEASKLFWGKESAYFLVEAQWLLEKACPGESNRDMAFLTNVQNMEVEYQPGISQKICLQRDETVQIQHNLVDTFWTSLKDRFPNVRKVILNHNEGNTSWQDDKEPFPLALQLLLQACPQGIESSVLFLEKKQQLHPAAETTNWRTATWQRCLFQQKDNGEWYKSEPESSRKTILMPPKQFKGPVGRFNQLRYQCYQKIPLQRFGLWPLMVEALDRHHFDVGRNVPFACPLPGCTAYFSQAGEWTVHAAESHYREWKRLLEILPSTSAGAGLRERSQALDRKTREVQEQFQEIKDAWVRGDETIQREIKRSWIEQLNGDAAWETEKKGEMSRLWIRFMEDLHSDY
jgi:hypothetical protein